ncbi:MAG: hypothetical protein FJ267_09265 [Planctomycetes bacterium]|nr:hypothetical protein [Planctomycetota bacterium]
MNHNVFRLLIVVAIAMVTSILVAVVQYSPDVRVPAALRLNPIVSAAIDHKLESMRTANDFQKITPNRVRCISGEAVKFLEDCEIVEIILVSKESGVRGVIRRIPFVGRLIPTQTSWTVNERHIITIDRVTGRTWDFTASELGDFGNLLQTKQVKLHTEHDTLMIVDFLKAVHFLGPGLHTLKRHSDNVAYLDIDGNSSVQARIKFVIDNSFIVHSATIE